MTYKELLLSSPIRIVDSDDDNSVEDSDTESSNVDSGLEEEGSHLEILLG